MSLLMEALRKAEAAKRAGQQADDSASDSRASELSLDDELKDEYRPVPDVFKYTSTDDLLALSPRDEIPSPPPTYARAAEKPLPVTDDVLDDYLSDPPDAEQEELPPARPERDRVKVQQLRERAAAASMFNAKAPSEERINKQHRLLILSGALVVTAVIIGGGWWYITSLSGSSVGANPALANYNAQDRGFLDSPPEAVSVTPTMQPASGTLSVTESTPDTAAAATTASTEPPSPDLSQAVPAVAPQVIDNGELAVSDPQLSAPYEADPREVAEVNQAPATTVVIPLAADEAVGTDPAVTSTATTFEISRANTSRPIQPTLQAAYDELLQGDVAAANDLYQEVLTQFPNNRDALLGLAAVQMRLENRNGARSTYARLLQLNPQDALARTGMLQSLPIMDAHAYQAELLALRERFPNLAPLSFALGNHYASENLWHEAQSAYFDALLQARREPGSPSPDYAFNLAVSLEQLGQSSAALEYYKEAQSLASNVKPGFDPMMLRQRLSELEQRQ